MAASGLAEEASREAADADNGEELDSDGGNGDGETFIEKYTRGVSAVETILTLDRLRQSVVVKELVAQAAKGRSPTNAAANGAGGGVGGACANGGSQFMRKTVSVPNFTNVRIAYNSMNGNEAWRSLGFNEVRRG